MPVQCNVCIDTPSKHPFLDYQILSSVEPYPVVWPEDQAAGTRSKRSKDKQAGGEFGYEN